MLRSVRPLLLLDRLPLCRQLSPALISSDHYLWSLTKCSGSSLGNNSAVGHAVAVAAAAVASPAATTFSTAARYFEQLDALDKSLSTTPAVDNIASWPGIKVWSKGGRSGLKAPYKPPSAAPWTPTSKLIKRKTYQKRSRFLLQVLEQEQQKQLAQGKSIPKFGPGDILEVATVVPEADRKVYVYKGVCAARANKGPRSWFKLYNVFPDAGGFIQHFPLYMPDLLSIKVVGRLSKVRRNKLYYLLKNEGPEHVYQTEVRVPK